MKQKTETNHKPKLNKSSKEEPSYDYDDYDDYDDSDGLNPQQQEYFADYLSRQQQEKSAQVEQAEQEEQLQPIDHDPPTDEENELVADKADVAEANTTENENLEPPEPEIKSNQI